MKCKSCNELVDAKFKHAISVNICPLCGEEIMDLKLQTILNELKIVMENSKEYPEEIADWLFSNYNLKKYDSSEFQQHNHSTAANFKVGKGTMVNRGESNDYESDEDSRTVFAKRAGVNNSMKKMIDFVHGKEEDMDPEVYKEELAYIQSTEQTPLDKKSANQLNNLFPEDNLAEIMELEKLKKIRNNNYSTGGNIGNRVKRTD